MRKTIPAQEFRECDFCRTCEDDKEKNSLTSKFRYNSLVRLSRDSIDFQGTRYFLGATLEYELCDDCMSEVDNAIHITLDKKYKNLP